MLSKNWTSFKESELNATFKSAFKATDCDCLLTLVIDYLNNNNNILKSLIHFRTEPLNSLSGVEYGIKFFFS